MKGQMFVVTMIFLVGLIFFVQQALFGYTALDLSEPLQEDEYYILENLGRIAREIIRDSSTCEEANEKITAFTTLVQRETIKRGYEIRMDYLLDCGEPFPPAWQCGDGFCDIWECLTGCTQDCTLGDCCGIEGLNLAIGEVCDDGGTQDCDGCRGDCTRPDDVCGDSIEECGEECDDGNQDNSDSCPDGAGGTCQDAYCGDGFAWTQDGGTEECDGSDDSACPGQCQAGCTCPAECGDGIVEPPETCDDGDSLNNDACPDGAGGTCQDAYCGDGFVWNTDGGSEDCDDGDLNNNDACPDGAGGTCLDAYCGDGFVWNQDGGMENCDDGNTQDGDGCSSECLLELEHDCPLGMVSYWRFDESSGLTAQDFLGVNPGTLTNMAGTEWVAGRLGNALLFDGINDFVNLGSDASLDIRDNITVEAWFNTPVLQNYMGIVSCGLADSYVDWGVYTYFDFPGELKSIIRTSYAVYILDNPADVYSANEWHHAAFTFDSGTDDFKYYIDGNLIDQETSVAGLIRTTPGWRIVVGRDRNELINFSGMIDEVAIYNRTLRLEEIETHYNDGSGMYYCSVGVCGNEVIEYGETCDDGDSLNNDACPDGAGGTCQFAVCGDGFLWDTDGGAEDCDDGDLNNNDACPDGAGGTCLDAYCGDGFVWDTDGGMETCDDGNTQDGDGCSSECEMEGMLFYDGFESGGLAGWTVWSDRGAPEITEVVEFGTCPMCVGTYKAKMTGGNGEAGGHACDGLNFCTGASHGVDSTGYTDVNLSWIFDASPDPYESPDEQLAMDFSCNGGSTWISVVNFNPASSFEQAYNMNLTAIDACAGNNPNLQIRFWQDATFSGEYTYVDEIFVKGL